MKCNAIHLLYCDDNIYCIELINHIHPPVITEFDISSFRRLIANLGRRLYDTPVDIEGDIVPLGAYTARLLKTLNRYLPDPIGSWLPSVDDDLALAILGKAIRWRIQEPDLLHTLYEYLISSIANRCPSDSDKFYTVGKLTKYAWFNTMLKKYFQRTISISDMESAHLKVLQDALSTETHPLFFKLREEISG
jgi:hypothetical protein